MPVSLLRRALQGLVLAAGLVVAGGASAHVTLVSSTPAADSHTSAFHHIELTFDGAVQPGASRVTVSRINGDRTLTPVENITVTHSNENRTLHAVPAQALSQGDYQVEWRVVGGDDHTVGGRYDFMIH